MADESVIQGEYDKEYKTMSICVNKNGQLVYQPDDMCKDRVALGKFRNAVNQTGSRVCINLQQRIQYHIASNTTPGGSIGGLGGMIEEIRRVIGVVALQPIFTI